MSRCVLGRGFPLSPKGLGVDGSKQTNICPLQCTTVASTAEDTSGVAVGTGGVAGGLWGRGGDSILFRCSSMCATSCCGGNYKPTLASSFSAVVSGWQGAPDPAALASLPSPTWEERCPGPFCYLHLVSLKLALGGRTPLPCGAESTVGLPFQWLPETDPPTPTPARFNLEPGKPPPYSLLT